MSRITYGRLIHVGCRKPNTWFYKRYTTRPKFVTSNSGINNFCGSTIYRFDKSDGDDRRNQERKANLGHMIEELKVLVPNILHKSLPKPIISKNIVLRICPTHFNEYNAYIPALKGQMSYYATCKAIQMVLTSVVLSPKVRLHIQSIRVTCENDPQTIYPNSTKIHIRWTTCSENCSHLSIDDSEFHSTSNARLGSHKWKKLDSQPFIQNEKNSNISKTMTTISQLTLALKGLTKESKKLERIISGIFIFELNSMNDEIIVHTIEDIDIIERTELLEINDGLRIC